MVTRMRPKNKTEEKNRVSECPMLVILPFRQRAVCFEGGLDIGIVGKFPLYMLQILFQIPDLSDDLFFMVVKQFHNIVDVLCLIFLIPVKLLKQI